MKWMPLEWKYTVKFIVDESVAEAATVDNVPERLQGKMS